MGVAGREFTPGIAYTDNGFAPEFFIRDALVFHPGTVDETVLACATKPVLAA
jgi:hypothetical protein